MSFQNEVITFGVMGAMLMLCIILFIRSAVLLWRKMKMEYQYLKHPRIVPYDGSKVCAHSHNWVDVMLALRGIEPGTYRICVACGVISGNLNVMVSDEVLEQTNENLALLEQKREFEKQVNERINDLTEGYVRQYVIKEFSDEFKDPKFVERLLNFSDFTLQAKEDAIQKVAAELEAQKDLDQRYAEWPKPKGNA